MSRASVPSGAPRPLARRPLAASAVLALASLFLAAPTPGNVGGCGGSGANTPIDPSRPPPGVPAAQLGQIPRNAEEAYFDWGLCSSFCLRLRECNGMCASLNPAPAECANPATRQAANDSPDAFVQCMRGELNANIFQGEVHCTHSCAGPERQPPGSLRYTRAFEWDLQACSDAMSQVACAALPGTLTSPPRECFNACR